MSLTFSVEVLPRSRRALGLGHLMTAGLIDSTGLAFGWTVLLLVVTRHDGLNAAAVLTSSSLAGTALSAPFSAWLSPRLSPRHLLQGLAGAEAVLRIGLFALAAAQFPVVVMAPLALLSSTVAWSAYAAMRAQVSDRARDSGDGHPGSGLTWYAVSIGAAEALAAGGAALLIVHPDPLVLVLVATVYTASLAPQWWVGAHARSSAPAGRRLRLDLRRVARPSLAGAVVFLIAAGPAQLATALAFERFGARGVIVAATAFTAGSLGSAKLQSVVHRIPSPTAAACLLGALMIGSWAAWSLGLGALALAQFCVGLGQCCLEGDLDARTLAEVGNEGSAAVTGLAIATSSRAVGGAVAVAALPAVIATATLPIATGAAGAVLLGTGLLLLVPGRFTAPRHAR